MDEACAAAHQVIHRSLDGKLGARIGFVASSRIMMRLWTKSHGRWCEQLLLSLRDIRRFFIEDRVVAVRRWRAIKWSTCAAFAA